MNMNEVVDRLFIKLEARFSTKPPFTRGQEVVDIVKEAWVEEFLRAGVTPADMKRGLDRAVDNGLKFFPDIGEFLALCRKTHLDLGLPSWQSAYAEACINAHSSAKLSWTHEAVRQAALRVTLHRLQREPTRYTETAFKEQYCEIISLIAEGAPMEHALEPPQMASSTRGALECPATTRYSEELAKSKHRSISGGSQEIAMALCQTFSKLN